MSKSLDMSDIKVDRLFDKNGAPTDIEYFRKILMHGIHGSVPHQVKLDPKNFGKNFQVWYQLSKETADGRLWDLRVFFRKVNGKPVANKLGAFCQNFIDNYFAPMRGREEGKAIYVLFGPAIKIRWQWDLMMLNIPGRFIEMVHDTFFKLLLDGFGD